jgi:GTPase
MYKSGFVGIIGRPNSGKSTLLNAILGEDIAITSELPQTTRQQLRGIHSCEQGQIVFIDTPGVHKTEKSFGTALNNLALNLLKDEDIDLILYLVDVSRDTGPEEEFLRDRILSCKKPVLMVYNKIDTVGNLTDTYNKFFNDRPHLEISALKKTNVDQLLAQTLEYLPEGSPFYETDQLTDRDMRFLASELIRRQVIHNLFEEIPHATAVRIDSFKELPGENQIEATIYVETESQKGIMIGAGGQMIKKIREFSRKHIKKYLEGKTSLQLKVKVKPNWRKDGQFLKSLGYE